MSSPHPAVPHPESKCETCVEAPTYIDEDMEKDILALLKDTNAVQLQQVYEPPPATDLTLPELA